MDSISNAPSNSDNYFTVHVTEEQNKDYEQVANYEEFWWVEWVILHDYFTTVGNTPTYKNQHFIALW